MELAIWLSTARTIARLIGFIQGILGWTIEKVNIQDDLFSCFASLASSFPKDLKNKNCLKKLIKVLVFCSTAYYFQLNVWMICSGNSKHALCFYIIILRNLFRKSGLENKLI